MPGEELPQVILDIKAQHAISWKSAVLLYDDTFDRDMISRAIISISRDFPVDETGDLVKPLSVSIYRIKESSHEWDRRKLIRSLLKSLPTKFIGKSRSFIGISLLEDSFLFREKFYGSRHVKLNAEHHGNCQGSENG